MDVYVAQTLVTMSHIFDCVQANSECVRGDSPEGEWTVKVNDQSGAPGAGTGKIIGLTVSFWGSAQKNVADPKSYVISTDMNVFPPMN